MSGTAGELHGAEVNQLGRRVEAETTRPAPPRLQSPPRDTEHSSLAGADSATHGARDVAPATWHVRTHGQSRRNRLGR